MSEKKWDVYVYGDVNVDIIIPGVETFPGTGTGGAGFLHGDLCGRRGGPVNFRDW